MRNTNALHSHLHFSFIFGKIAVLIDYAFGAFQKMLFGAIIPPVDQVPIQIELTSLIVESMSDFMTNNEPHSAVIHISWTFSCEKHSLQNPSRQFYYLSYKIGEMLNPQPFKIKLSFGDQ